ncbi:ABC transporter ATP-binding protein [Aliikangiella sp. IMCC44359]|uniref:ABC transporter ATP-binding protein n=1 Tax=Aliikangiella sp. IMCC44359 TaxID=3459125 RepID=UPI00403B1F1A
MSLVKLESVKKQFADLSILKGVDLILSQGEVLGLFGHNGAGKTTIMKMILGLLAPSSGKVTVFEQDPCSNNFSHHRYQLGFLPENVSFYPQLTGLETIQFLGKLKKVSRQSCENILKQVGLYEASHRKVKNYSKGMKQRLGLAQALLTQPSLLLLDEPTVGLDPIATQEFYSVIEELRQKGCSIILCSHILPGVEKHIDKAAILSQGQLKAYGSIETLRNEAKLNTQIIFSGCFDIENLSKDLKQDIQLINNGQYKITLPRSEKLETIKCLVEQPGLKNIDTLPPDLEQLYRHFIEKDHEIINFPKKSKQTNLNETNQRSETNQ